MPYIEEEKSTQHGTTDHQAMQNSFMATVERRMFTTLVKIICWGVLQL